jgi:hypothetical protein
MGRQGRDSHKIRFCSVSKRNCVEEKRFEIYLKNISFSDRLHRFKKKISLIEIITTFQIEAFHRH